MSTHLKTQLSLILLAGIGVVGLMGFFFQSVKDNFVLQVPQTAQTLASTNDDDSKDPATLATAENSGSVLGVAENPYLNPLKNIYVNPFKNSSNNSGPQNVRKSVAGEQVLLGVMQPKPTAPIQSYIRGYVYPMAELNNCSSENGCFQYCENVSNMAVCAMFSERQGLMKSDMVPVAQRLAVAFLSDSYFANCNTASSCVTLCDDESKSAECGQLASAYKLDARVLGASDGDATNTNNSTSGNSAAWAANPYANLSTNYSNPALNEYLANNSNSQCQPLDMICQQQLEAAGQTNPRVLNLRYEDILIDDGGGSGGGSGDDGNSDTEPNPITCSQNLTPGTAIGNNVTFAPNEVQNATDFWQGCAEQQVENSEQEAEYAAENKKQEVLSDQVNFQRCIAGSRNLAVDVPRCINQELR